MSAVVIAFCGRIRSGKSTLSKALAERLAINRVSFGDYARKVATFLGLDPTDRAALQDIGELLVKRLQPFCREVLALVGYQPGQCLVVDGVRSVAMLEELREQVKPAVLIIVYVWASDATIAKRLAQAEPSGVLSIAEEHITEIEVRHLLLAKADITLKNEDGDQPDDTVETLVAWLREYQHLPTE